MIANEAFLGVRPARKVLYCVIASPVGSYFASGVKPVSIWVSTDFNRAGPGGTGAAKCGGNYAASLAAQTQAAASGCDQAVFLDTVERKWVEELGGMNVFFVMRDGQIVTPELTGTILEGVTRSALLQVAADRGYTPVERRVSIDEWRDGIASGEITEVFACGTAAVITPIGRLAWDGGEAIINSNETGRRGAARRPPRCPVRSRRRPARVDDQAGMTPPPSPARPLLVATDLDGTLLRSDGSVSPRTRAALAATEAAGIPVVFVTARPPRWLDELADVVGGHGVALCGNGAFTYDVHARVVSEVRPIGAADLHAIIVGVRAAYPSAPRSARSRRCWTPRSASSSSAAPSCPTTTSSRGWSTSSGGTASSRTPGPAAWPRSARPG